MTNDTQKKDFEILSHTADLKIRVYGKTIEDLFVHSLMGMFQAIKPRAQGCHYKRNRLVCSKFDKEHEIKLSSHNLNSLLVDFLSQAIALSDIHNEAYLDARLVISNNYDLNGMIYGIAIQGFEEVEIKAVTYHDLDIQCVKGVWQTTIVFDI